MRPRSGWRVARALVFAAVAAFATQASAAVEDTMGSAADLGRRYAELKVEAASPFGLPLHLASSHQDSALRGDIHSRVDHRFEAVRDALHKPDRWCEIMILHPNVKGCRVLGGGNGSAGKLEVRIGRAEHAVEFDFRVAKAEADYLDVRLDAPAGPAGTTDYRIRVEAAPLSAGATVLHLAYSHGFGTQAKLAMDAYFATFGRDKVGFSVVGKGPDGAPRYVRDLRGGMERNAMRYYLAIRSTLEVLALPDERRLEQGLAKFVAYTERWPLQLKEEPGFVEAKRRDIAKMRTAS